MTQDPAHSEPWTVYLLHFMQPVSGRLHYVGITTPARLQPRMIEHTTGRGAWLTRHACQQRVSWRLAFARPARTRAAERHWQERADEDGVCPICAGLTPGMRYSPTQKGDDRGRRLFANFTLQDPQLFPNSDPEQLPLFGENSA